MLEKPQPGYLNAHRDLAFLLVVVVACALPFIAQPFHMDDNFYMDMARNALVEPLYPNDTPYVFEGRHLSDMGSHSHPPGQTYFLALVQQLGGEGQGREWLYHSAALIFPISAVWAFYFIAARFVSRPIWPALALACCPLFLVMQHTLMTDVPALAFWLAAVAAFLRATDSGKLRYYVLSGAFQFAALFTSYQSAILAPLLWFYHYRRRGRAAGWITPAIPLVLMAAWFVLNYLHYHRWLLGDTYGYIQSRSAGTAGAILTKAGAVLGYQGWLVVFPLFLVYAFGRALRGRVAALALLSAIYVTQLAVPRYGPMGKVIFTTGLMTGILVLCRMIPELAALFRFRTPGDASAGAEFPGLWYFAVLACCLLLFTEGSARYILPLVPPVLLVLFRGLECTEVSEYRLARKPLLSSAMAASGSVVVSLFWGLLLSEADLEFARVYPRAATEFSRIAGGIPSYYGGEWGFRYYMRQAGIYQLPVDQSMVSGGSLLALPSLALRYELPADLFTMSRLVQTLTYELNTPLRLMDRNSHAGFYSSAWGLLPFSLSRRSLESVDIRQIDFLVDRLPWAKAEPAGGEAPWPGYQSIEEKSLLALLARQGSRLTYPWTFDQPLDLHLECGVSPAAYHEGDKAVFEFGIRQCDSKSNVLSEVRLTLKPGMVKADRGWHEVRVPLKPRSQGAETLQLTFSGTSVKPAAIGAFGEAILRPVP